MNKLKMMFTKKVRELNEVEYLMNKNFSTALSKKQRELIDECSKLSDDIGDGCPNKVAIYGYKPNGEEFK